MISKLALGTVQFGIPYGLTNASGQVNREEINRILHYAQSQGISVLDTAQGYGESEAVLGTFDLSPFQVITKVKGTFDIAPSLERLKLQTVYGLMLHDESECNDQTWEWLAQCKKDKQVQKIGVSVYSPDILRQIISRYPIDIVQLPYNLLDRRFEDLLPELKSRHIEIHCRSVFLQGLILQNPQEIHPYFRPIQPILEKLPTQRLAAAIQFVYHHPLIDKIVVGVTKKQELEQILDALDQTIEPFDADSFIISDEKYILPQNWILK